MPINRSGHYPVTPASPSHVNIIDTVSLFAVTEDLKRCELMPAGLQFQYQPLLAQLARFRQSAVMREADLNLAPITLDLRNEKQAKFQKALEVMGIVCNPTDFRQAFVSAVGVYAQKFPGGLFPSVAPQIAYALGLLAARTDTDVVIVSGSFDIYIPLQDYVMRGGKAVVAFFKGYLDPRWEQSGVFIESSHIGFFDLEPYAEDLLGVKLQRVKTQVRSGLQQL
jgi:hypothetical protein